MDEFLMWQGVGYYASQCEHGPDGDEFVRTVFIGEHDESPQIMDLVARLDNLGTPHLYGARPNDTARFFVM